MPTPPCGRQHVRNLVRYPTKGSTANKAMARHLRSIAHALRWSNLWMRISWVVSWFNPADCPSHMSKYESFLHMAADVEATYQTWQRYHEHQPRHMGWAHHKGYPPTAHLPGTNGLIWVHRLDSLPLSDARSCGHINIISRVLCTHLFAALGCRTLRCSRCMTRSYRPHSELEAGTIFAHPRRFLSLFLVLHCADVRGTAHALRHYAHVVYKYGICLAVYLPCYRGTWWALGGT